MDNSLAQHDIYPYVFNVFRWQCTNNTTNRVRGHAAGRSKPTITGTAVKRCCYPLAALSWETPPHSSSSTVIDHCNVSHHRTVTALCRVGQVPTAAPRTFTTSSSHRPEHSYPYIRRCSIALSVRCPPAQLEKVTHSESQMSLRVIHSDGVSSRKHHTLMPRRIYPRRLVDVHPYYLPHVACACYRPWLPRTKSWMPFLRAV